MFRDHVALGAPLALHHCADLLVDGGSTLQTTDRSFNFQELGKERRRHIKFCAYLFQYCAVFAIELEGTVVSLGSSRPRTSRARAATVSSQSPTSDRQRRRISMSSAS